ncbi:MAG: hypothetical protein AAGG08_01000 [Actinomycetota bacterium]
MAAAAAIALSAGAVGMQHVVGANTAATASSFVPITPVRVLDTRVDVGLTGRLASEQSRKLQITGFVPTLSGSTTTNQLVVPATATGVTLNVTAVRPTHDGFVSVRPGDATGTPGTSSLNVTAGGVVPNSVTVAVPTSGTNAGALDLFYFGSSTTATTDLLVDVVGYFVPSSAGPAGPQGPAGPAGSDAPRLSNVVHVAASGGDFTDVQSAMDSITDAAADNPYVVQVGPGVFDGKVTVIPFVDLVGSGRGATILTSDGGPHADGGVPLADNATVNVVEATSTDTGVQTISDLTVRSTTTGAENRAVGIHVADGVRETRIDRVTVEVEAGAGDGYGVVLGGGDRIVDSRISVTAYGEFLRGVQARGDRSMWIQSSRVSALGDGPNAATVRVARGSFRVIESFVDATGTNTVGIDALATTSLELHRANVFSDDVGVMVDGTTRISDSFIRTAATGATDAALEVISGPVRVTDSTLHPRASGPATCIDSRSDDGALDRDCQTTGPAPTTVWWAKVDADGTGATVLSSNSTDAAASRDGLGRFVVSFGPSLSGCGFLATLGDNDDGVATSGQIATELGSSDTDVWVRTYDETGVAEDPIDNDGFTVTAFCS